jgi:hypothetical protein
MSNEKEFRNAVAAYRRGNLALNQVNLFDGNEFDRIAAVINPALNVIANHCPPSFRTLAIKAKLAFETESEVIGASLVRDLSRLARKKAEIVESAA